MGKIPNATSDSSQNIFHSETRQKILINIKKREKKNTKQSDEQKCKFRSQVVVIYFFENKDQFENEKRTGPVAESFVKILITQSK